MRARCRVESLYKTPNETANRSEVGTAGEISYIPPAAASNAKAIEFAKENGVKVPMMK